MRKMNKLIIDNSVNIEEIIVDSDMDITISFNDCKRILNIQVMPGVCLKIFDISNNTNNKGRLKQYAIPNCITG